MQRPVRRMKSAHKAAFFFSQRLDAFHFSCKARMYGIKQTRCGTGLLNTPLHGNKHTLMCISVDLKWRSQVIISSLTWGGKIVPNACVTCTPIPNVFVTRLVPHGTMFVQVCMNGSELTWSKVYYL